MIYDIHHTALNRMKAELTEHPASLKPHELSPVVRAYAERLKQEFNDENHEAFKIAINAFWEGYEAGYLRG